jgi:hypothetical protein
VPTAVRVEAGWNRTAPAWAFLSRLRRGLTVVTANTSEFSRVSGLSWEDWTN